MELGEEDLAQFFSLTSAFLDERQRRLQAASMVEVLGRGGQARVAEATSMSRNTLIAGAKDLAEGPTLGGVGVLVRKLSPAAMQRRARSDGPPYLR
ncbi:MAG: hypothetical protein ACYDEP_08735 [Acidimicrobiales bacterium]|jgi:hypothetical protein